MNVITAEQLRKAAPNCKDPVLWVRALNAAMEEFGINSDIDFMVEFLAQAAHESGSFNRLEESLNYTADRLAAVWPSRFGTKDEAGKLVPNADARRLAGRPHELADFVYGGRFGNDQPGDGWKYRGRGFGVTFKDNYVKVSKLMNDPLVIACPDRLCTKDGAARAFAAWWSSDPKLNALAQDETTDNDEADFVGISKIVNGGKTGIEERRKFRAAFKEVLEV